jgi:hypothetical protein
MRGQTDLVPPSEPFLLQHASEDMDGAAMFVPSVVMKLVRGRAREAFLHGIFDVSRARLDAHLGHDVRIRHLRRRVSANAMGHI